MHRNWKIFYLANVLTVFDADGDLRPIEVLYSEYLRQRLDLNQQQAAEALLVSRFEPPSLFIHESDITNEQNLVDMLVAKRLDGTIDPCEAVLVSEFILEAAIPEHRLVSLRDDAAHRHRRFSNKIRR